MSPSLIRRIYTFLWLKVAESTPFYYVVDVKILLVSPSNTLFCSEWEYYINQQSSKKSYINQQSLIKKIIYEMIIKKKLYEMVINGVASCNSILWKYRCQNLK